MRRLVIFLSALLSIAPPLRADVQMSVDIGWDNHYRIGRWTPIYVNATNDAPRQVVIELYAPTDRRYAMSVREGIALNPSPVTVPIYIPASQPLDETTVTIR